MKHLFPLLLSLVFPYFLRAQNYVNPFDERKNEFNQQDILILWDDPVTGEVDQRLFGYDFIAQLGGQTANLVTPLTAPVTVANMNMGTGQYLSSSVGYFNDDLKADVFYMVETATSWRCAMANVESPYSDPDSAFVYDMLPASGHVDIARPATHGYPRTTVGDFDGDGTDEVAIAWWETGGDLVHIRILDGDNSLMLQSRASIADRISLRLNGIYHAYDLGTGDLNGDGSDELILTGIENSGSGNATYQTYVQVYEVNTPGCQTITPQAYIVLNDAELRDSTINGNQYQLGYAQTAILGLMTHADTLPNTSKDLLATFAYKYLGQQQITYDNFFQYLLRASSDLSMLSVLDTSWQHLNYANFDQNYPLDRVTGDLNGDFVDDALFAATNVHVFTVLNDTIQYKGTHGGLDLNENNNGILESLDRIETGDIDQDGRDEIITHSKSYDGFDQHTFSVQTRGVDENFQFDASGSGSSSYTETYSGALRSYAVAIGNLDGRDVHLGEPLINSCEYVQPMFVIGAIPNHFDVLGTDTLDVNNCYPVQDCDQEVLIRTSQSTTTSTTAQFNADWAVSSELEVGGSLEAKGVGFNLGTTLSAQYGVRFEEVNTQTNTQTLSISITASADDMVEYVKIPVTTYRYPVMNVQDDTLCWVLAVFPDDNLSPQTIVANGKSLFNFTPDHEVGNLLSYPPINSGYNEVIGLPPTSGEWIILPPGSIPNYTMSPSGGITYTLTSTSDLSWSDASTAYASVNTGVSTLGFGLGLPDNQDGTQYLEAEGLPSNFPPNKVDMSQLRLFEQEINDQTEFHIAPTNVIGSPNEFNYVISPKIYWNTDGGGSVSFDLDMNGQPGSGSYWSLAYTAQSDPALNMPYRYEQVINPNLSNTENLDRTKSLWFNTSAASEGDTVSAFIRVFNYSFMATPGPVEFTLYHEHPDQGGVQLSDVDGNSLFQTSVALVPRGREVVEVRIIANAALITDDFAKIYVKLDPNDLITEIHEENGLGWAQFGYACNQPGTPTGITNPVSDRSEIDVLSVYPVPANDQVIIEHDLRAVRTQGAFLTIRDLAGVEIDRFAVPTTYAGRIFWNTRAVASGMYMIFLQDGNGVLESGKALVTH